MNNSAHRSSESAHRSGAPELKTEVFFVKTDDDMDAVIVSFVDNDDVNGIYLYEPGAEPVELSAVGIDGVATEFEYATVSGETADGEEVSWPGDGMVTRAERDAEDFHNLQQAYDTLWEQAQALVDTARGQHFAGKGHDVGAWTLCANPVCKAASAVEL